MNENLNVGAYLNDLYNKALEKSTKNMPLYSELPDDFKTDIDTVVEFSESSKGVLAVTMTSLVYKALHHEQDVRCHQSSIEGGYSGRTFDTHYITPFLREKSFPNMAESGWLTRSLEQKAPYTMAYKGAITPPRLKRSFLMILDAVQSLPIGLDSAIEYLLFQLIQQRDSKKIELAKPQNLSILTIMDILEEHFMYAYKGRGASRLPVLAFYAVYQLIVGEVKRYSGKKLLPLESHTSADVQSGRLGDIDIVDEQGDSFEAIEIKHEIPIDKEIVLRAKEKILPSCLNRYYILSTSHVKKEDELEIQGILNQVKNTHGCQIVVNGVMPSLKYYLRLIENPNSFITNYVSLMANDDTVRFEHKEVWNRIISEM